MSLLQFVERHLGLIYFWPKNILKHLFIDPPTYLSTMALITYFYGNGIPVEIAVQLFQACNNEVTLRSDSALLLLLCYMAISGRWHSSWYILQHENKQTHVYQWFTKKTIRNCSPGYWWTQRIWGSVVIIPRPQNWCYSHLCVLLLV